MILRPLLVAVLLVAGLTGSATSTPAAAAPAQATGECATTDGVTVVVSFNELRGGQTLTRCASGSPGSGFEVLSRVGLPATQPQRMPGFVCRIDGLPSDDPCINTPPTSAYWAYWVAPRGGDWCYSNLGPGRKPPPGTVEGWSFSKGRGGSSPARPAIAPPPPIPGLDPTPLPASHCTAAPTISAPTVPTSPSTPPANPAPPAPANPSAPSRPGGGGSGGGGSGGGASSPGAPTAPGRSDGGSAPGDERPTSDHDDRGSERTDDDEGEDGPEGEGEPDENDGDDADGDESDTDDETEDSDGSTSEEAAALDAWQEEAEAAASRGSEVDDEDSGGGSPWALIVVGLVAGGLAVGGYLRNRRTWTA